MKKTVYALSGLLLLFALFMFAILGASGHSISLKDNGILTYLILIALYLSTSGALLLLLRKDNAVLRKIAMFLVIITLISFSYLIYEALKIEIDDYSILIPLGLLITIIGLGIKLLYYLIHHNGSDVPKQVV